MTRICQGNLNWKNRRNDFFTIKLGIQVIYYPAENYIMVGAVDNMNMNCTVMMISRLTRSEARR